MIEMARREFIPAICKYTKVLSEAIGAKRALRMKLDTSYEEKTLRALSDISSNAFVLCENMEALVVEIRKEKDVTRRGDRVRDELAPRMEKLREMIDYAESITDRAHWPVPTYGELLYGVR